MKRVLMILLLASIFSYSYGQENTGFKTILSKAKSEKKYTLILYDLNNENNPASSKLSEPLFKEYYLVQRYSLSSDEGKELNTILGVGTYPALYFFNPQGKLIYMDFGTKSPVELINIGSEVITLDSKKEKDDYSVDAPYTKLQRKWYTSKALGLYADDALIINKHPDNISVQFKMPITEIGSLIDQAYKLTPHNYYLYYLSALISYQNGSYNNTKKNLYVFTSKVNYEKLPNDMSDNIKIMLNNMK